MELNTSAIIFLILFIVIIIIWLVRLSTVRSRAAKLRRNDPEHAGASIRPTFTETARDVSGRVFGQPTQNDPYSAFHSARSTERREAVTRQDVEAGDPELPSYGDTSTMPVPPSATYSSPITARHDTRYNGAALSVPPTADAPPKYDEAPPIVRTI